jgi:hypothetical protein
LNVLHTLSCTSRCYPSINYFKSKILSNDIPELDNPDQDPVEKLDLAKRRIRDLKDSLEAKKIELARLQKQIEEMAQQKKVKFSIALAKIHRALVLYV